MVDDTKRLDGNGLARVWTATQKLVADNINDGVPVNGVVEFDGLEADIPDGYTKIGTRDSRLLIKKGEKTIPVRSTVVNEETASDTDVYSCEYINDKLEDIEDAFSGTTPQGDIVVDSIRSKNMFNGALEQASYGFGEGAKTYNNPYYCAPANKIPVKAGKTYTLSFVSSVSFNLNACGFVFFNNDTYVGYQQNTLTATVPSGANYMVFDIGAYPNTITPSDISNVQLEEGSIATTYIPYQELNPDNFKNEEIVVGSIKSKNMCSEYYNNCAWAYADGVFVPYSQYTASNKIKVKPNTTYTLSSYATRNNLANPNETGAIFWDNNGNFISFQRGYTITTPANCYILAFNTNKSDDSELQLELGSTATNYMPYQNLDGMETYSTSEIKIGTWIDGRTLYRKVIDLGSNVSINAGDWASSGKTLPNYKIIINSYACKEADATSQIRATIGTNDTIMIMNPANFNISVRYIIVEYTKTTD